MEKRLRRFRTAGSMGFTEGREAEGVFNPIRASGRGPVTQIKNSTGAAIATPANVCTN